MKYCDACKVTIDSKTDRCPLCYSELKRIAGPENKLAYPDIINDQNRYNLFLRILLFLSIISVAVCVTVDYFTVSKYPWSIVVVAGVAFVWISVGTAVRKHKKIGFNLMMQEISISLLMILLGHIFGFAYFVYNYILPAIFVSVIISFNVLAIIKYRDINNIILYDLIVSLIGLVPIILYFTGVMELAWPMAISVLSSILSIVGMFIFAGKATKTELEKRFHI